MQQLLNRPGASRTLVATNLLYAESSLWRYLQQPVSSACSSQTTALLAHKALTDAAMCIFTEELAGAWPCSDKWAPVAKLWRCRGVGVSCALATVNLRKGPDRVYVQCSGFEFDRISCCNMRKRDRTDEMKLVDDLVSRTLRDQLAHRLNERWPHDTCALMGAATETDQEFYRTSQSWNAVQKSLFQNVGGYLLYLSRGLWWHRGPLGKSTLFILSGSFNPVHHGHHEMLRHVASQETEGGSFLYELCIHNADKGEVPFEEMESRLGNFSTGAVLITSAPRFIDKVRLLRREGCKNK